MKKVVITGEKGYLSNAIFDRLSLDQSLTSLKISLRGEGLNEANLNGVEVIIHPVGITPSKAKQNSDYYDINTNLTKQLSIKAKAQGVKHFIYISTMAVYGKTQSIDLNEGTVDEATECNPDSDYGKSKLLAEEHLRSLEDENFKVAIIRVPSIYAKGQTEYLDQYKYLAQKLPFIPKVFPNNYKSAIGIDNLAELIYLTVIENYSGIICPDDGKYSAVDYCKAIFPKKKVSTFVGKLIEVFLGRNGRILDYYGAIRYAESMTNVFDGKYRALTLEQGVKKAYEE